MFKVLHVPQPMHEKLRSASPNNWVYGVKLVSSSDSAGQVMTISALESMQRLGMTGKVWIIGEVVNNDQYLEHILVFSVFSLRG